MNLTSPLSGFPNGRTVQDDVVDTALSALRMAHPAWNVTNDNRRGE